ncbi:MAG: response regulator [Jatrophihabitans sp.]|nr:MAG: response regulator [Jatrophihabitans sp.]
MARVLVVDDEPQILRALRINLHARQYEVITAVDGGQALQAAERGRPDIVVLDLGLPDMEGAEVIRRLRAWSPVPILVLSGRSGSKDKVEALDVGADDYVTKPFSIDELLARIRAVTRRTGPSGGAANVEIGEFTVDLEQHDVHLSRDPDQHMHLTRTEWQLLTILATNPGKLISQRQLLQQVWGPTYRTETHYLRQYMAQLRRKLETDPSRPRHLLTEPGMGYRFQP